MLPIRALLLSLLAQCCGFSAGVLLGQHPSVSLIVALSVHALVATLVAIFLQLPLPWRVFNAVLPIAAMLAGGNAIPAWLFAIVLLLLLLVYLPTFWTRVPFYPASSRAIDELASLLPAEQAFRFVDIGSGFGSVALHLARRFPMGTFEGVEISVLPWLVSGIRALGLRNVRFRLRNFWHLDLRSYHVVYAFLSPTPMPELWEKVSRELESGSIFVSNTFPAPGEAQRVIPLEDHRQHALYVYEFSAGARSMGEQQ